MLFALVIAALRSPRVVGELHVASILSPSGAVRRSEFSEPKLWDFLSVR